MKFEVGETIELIADGGLNCGKFTIDHIIGDIVWFEPRYGSGRQPMDLLRRCRKIIKPGQQLEWDW